MGYIVYLKIFFSRYFFNFGIIRYMSMEEKQKKNTQQYLNLLMANQFRIRAYVSALVTDGNDVDDIMQETITLMWEKFENFTIGTNFAAWGTKIAYFNILKYRQKKGKNGLLINDDLFKQMVNITEIQYDKADDRKKALRNCVKKLNEGERKLLEVRYDLNVSVKGISERTGRTAKYIYRSLSRIHHSLHKCVHRTLTKEGLA